PGARDAAGTKPRTANLAVGEVRTWGSEHVVAIEVSPPSELDAIAEDRQSRIETTQFLPDVGATHHSAGRDPEPLLRLVALPLIDLVHIEVELAAPSAGNADADLADRLAAVPMSRQQQLWACQVNALVDRYVSQQLITRVRGGYGIVVQQPQPVRVVRRDCAKADGIGVMLQAGSVE